MTDEARRRAEWSEAEVIRQINEAQDWGLARAGILGERLWRRFEEARADAIAQAVQKEREDWQEQYQQMAQAVRERDEEIRRLRELVADLNHD
jgi:hypothetical protein